MYKFFYEIKYVNGSTFGGHNLISFWTKNDILYLSGYDFYSGETHPFIIPVLFSEISEFKIFPMGDDD